MYLFLLLLEMTSIDLIFLAMTFSEGANISYEEMGLYVMGHCQFFMVTSLSELKTGPRVAHSEPKCACLLVWKSVENGSFSKGYKICE